MDYDFERAAAAARWAEGHYESLHVSFLLSSFARDTLVLKAQGAKHLIDIDGRTRPLARPITHHGATPTLMYFNS